MKLIIFYFYLLKTKMENQNESNTKLFTFDGINSISRVVDITDGDTIKTIIKFKDEYYKIIVRLNNIDTCETKSKIEENKNMGIKAKQRLFNLITGKENATNDKKAIKKELNDNVYLIWLKCYDFDKYGRVMGDIYAKEQDIKSFSDILIDEKLAYKYQGKTKLTEEEQLKILCE